MDYQADYAVLEGTGKRASVVADAVTAALPSMRIDGVGAAIPGGVSGAVADKLDESWRDVAAELEKGLSSYADALEATARNYRTIEDEASQSVRSFFGGAS